MEIKNKVIIVTGASSGIGEAAAKLLASKGAKVVLAARSIEKLNDISKDFPDSLVIETDMTKADSIKKMVAKAKKHYGRVDVLVNNAGRGTAWKTIEEIDLADFEDILKLNVMGPVIAMQEVIPLMREQGGGSIVNIGSGTVKMMREGAGVYPGSKILLTHLSKVARLELAKESIAVSIIHPFITKTNFFKNINGTPALGADFMKLADEPEKVAEEIANAIETGAEEIDMASGKMNRPH